MASVHQPADGHQCPLCGGTIFRRSRFSLADIPRFLFLEIPIRCQECGERANVFFPKAIKAVRSSAKLRPKINQQDH